MRLTRILVCIDGSGASFQAARAAIDLACQTRSELFAVAVVDTGRLGEAGMPGTEEQREADAGAALDRVCRMAREKGVGVEARLRSGTVFEEILDAARREQCDLIVMGRTGRRGPGSGIMGSSVLRVAEFADRPLLLVPTSEGSRSP